MRTEFGTARSTRVLATYDSYVAAGNVVSMGGRAILGIHNAPRAAIGKNVGDTVRVSLTVDDSPRTLEIPAELVSILEVRSDVRVRFDALAFSHRWAFAAWVDGASRQETRDRRAVRAAEMIDAGQTL